MNEDTKKKVPLTQTEEKARALLISSYRSASEKSTCEEYLNELALLTETYGAMPSLLVPCHLRRYESATFLTEGKLQEMIALANENQVDLIIIDEEISPAQQRNLQKAFGRRVMDRTEVILEVFSQRAQTKEARLQIELAKIKYELPRLKNLWTHLSRQGGSVGGSGAYLKGEGEKQIEIDRRIVKRKIELLQKEIEEVVAIRATQRSARVRNKIPTFAIVGYTNAGKSTLLNALTKANVFVEDKLFATLDTTTRKFTLPNNQDILLIDTVGFIRKLPHLLVAAFKSTLEESIEADILLHLIDISNPLAEAHAKTALQVLKELGASSKAMITVFNKVDNLESKNLLTKYGLLFPNSVAISATQETGLDELFYAMVEELKKQRKAIFLRIPQSDYSSVSEVMRLGNVLNKDFDENDVLLEVEVDAPLAEKMKKYLFQPAQ